MKTAYIIAHNKNKTDSLLTTLENYDKYRYNQIDSEQKAWYNVKIFETSRWCKAKKKYNKLVNK